MTVTFDKPSIAGVVLTLVLLAGCSFNGEIPIAEQWDKHQNEAKASSKQQPGALETCVPEAGSPFHFRKVVLVAGTVGVPEMSRDLPGLAGLTSRRLQSHLDSLQRFNIASMHDSSFKSMASGTTGHVKYLGEEYASQFVVKIEIEDMTTHSAWSWLPSFLRGRTERHVAMKLYIYGTEYGALFHSEQYNRTVSGDVIGFRGHGNTVTTPWFETDLGLEVDNILKAMSMKVNEKLACVPFSTKVNAVEGDNIHINAGYLHGVHPGATLRVYRNKDMLAPDATGEQRKVERWIKVNAVFPNRSIATASQIDADGKLLDIGDVVRAW